VARSSIQPPAVLREVGRNLTIDVTAAIGVGVCAAFVQVLMPTIARQGGLGAVGLAALASAPFVANLSSAFAGRIGPRSARQIALTRALGAGSLILLLVMPHPFVMVVVAIALWVSLSYSAPLQLRIWGAIYPARIRARCLGVIGTVRTAASATAAFAGGILATALGGATAIAVAGVVGVVCAVTYVGIRAGQADRPPAFSAMDSLRILRARPILGRIVLAQGFYGGGLVAALPLYALVNVDRLELSLVEVGTIGVTSALATMSSLLLWGYASDRYGPIAILRVGATVGLTSIVAYAFAPDIRLLWYAALAGGIASAATEVGLAIAISSLTSLDTRGPAMAAVNVVTGARGIVAAFTASVLVQSALVSITVGLVLCALITLVGVVLYFRVSSELADVAEMGVA
jgi:MFS family permease